MNTLLTTRMRGHGLLLAVCLAVVMPAAAQRTSNWRLYRAADGLAETPCIGVSVSPQGKILVRHPAVPLISQLNGYTVTNLPAPEAVKGRVYESPSGQQWLMAPDGLLERTVAEWQSHPLPELVNDLNEGPGRVLDPVPLCPVRQGSVLMLLPQKLLEITLDEPGPPRRRVLRTAETCRLGRFLGLGPARDGGIWISGTKGLAKIPGPVRSINSETPWTEYLAQEDLHITNLISPQDDNHGGVLAVAESTTNEQRVIVLFDGHNWEATLPGIDRLRRVWRGTDGRIWACSTAGLYVSSPGQTQFLECDEISARQYFDVAVEPTGTFWMATSDGLYRHAALAWQPPTWTLKRGPAVRCLSGDGEGSLILLFDNYLQVIASGKQREAPLSRAVNLSLPIHAAYDAKTTNLVLETEGRMLSVAVADGRVSAWSPGREMHLLGSLADGTVCAHRPGTSNVLAFEQGEFRPRLTLPATNGAGSRLRAILGTQNGDVWLAGEQGLALRHEDRWRSFSTNESSIPAVPIYLAETADGRIWSASEERVCEFDGRAWSVLQRGFDGITGVIRTRDGSMWVASNNGLHRYYQQSWIQQGVEEGLPGAIVTGIWDDPRLGLWAATTRGLAAWRPEADRDAPRSHVLPLGGKDNSVPESEFITIHFSGQDKWNYTVRDRLLFSCRWDRNDWTPFREQSQIELADLPPGKHYFQVRAMDRNGNVETEPAQMEFAVMAPWYQETRLVLIVGTGCALVLFFAGVAFNRHLQLLHSYAEIEQKVTERTRQLEQANRELAHSQKMTALGTLAAGIAHDFNNILSIIKGSAQIIEDNLENPDKVQTRLDRIKTVVEQGAGIVRAMLGFSRDTDQQPCSCEVNPIIADTLKLLGDRFLRETHIQFEPAEGLPEVVVSREFVQQILLNLIFNAAEAAANNKQVIIRAERLQAAPAEVVLAPRPAPGYAAITVQDFGCGIPPENLSRIFEPFFTTKGFSARRGTGLGLSMAYELARKMGAGLVVRSAVGQGSVFTLLLPQADPSPCARVDSVP